MPALLKRHAESLTAVALVTLLALLAYGPLLPSLGFYRDDWYMLWAGNTLGPESIVTLFSIDRPLVGVLYSLAFRVFGSDPLAWQLYAFGLRWIGALAFLWIVRMLWPRAPLATTAMAALFVVYPGFQQQPNANTFSNQLMTYTLSLVSIGLTLRALLTSRPFDRWLLTALAALTGLLYMLLYEYMIGMEGLRLLLIAWIVVRNRVGASWAARLREAVIRAWPYLIAVALNLGWRLLFFQSGREATDLVGHLDRLRTAPLETLPRMAATLGQDLVETVLFAWAVPVYNAWNLVRVRELLVSASLGLLAALLLLAAARRMRPLQVEGAEDWATPSIVLGMLTVVATLLPVLLAGREVRWDSGFDRYTLQAIAGVALLVVGLLGRFAQRHALTGCIAGLVALSVAGHFGNAVHWRDFWNQQRALWWQLSWRAPQLQDGTVLVAEIPGAAFFEDYEVWAPANLIYNPAAGPIRIGAEILTEQTAHDIRLGTVEIRDMRTIIKFTRDFNHTLVLTIPSAQTCMHALDLSRFEFPSGSSSLIRSLHPFSHTDQIAVDLPSAHVPADLFGPEPEHGWCYYFQRAELSRQQGEWEQIVRLGDQAAAEGLTPMDPGEWLPFLEGYLMTGLPERAASLAVLVRDQEAYRHSLCDSLSVRPDPLPDPESSRTLTRLLCEFE